MGVKYKSGMLSAKYKNLEKTFKCVKISKEFKTDYIFFIFPKEKPQILYCVSFNLTEYNINKIILQYYCIYAIQ